MISEKAKIKKHIIRYPDLTDIQLSKKLKIHRGKVYRARKELLDPKPSTDVSSPKNAALTLNGFSGIGEKFTDEKSGLQKIRVSHAVGPITGNRFKLDHFSMFGTEPQYSDDVINHWQPHMSLAVFGREENRALTAAEINFKRQEKRRWIPNLYVNPMHELDYITFEAIGRSTFGSPLVQALVKFIVGTGFKPELELINPNQDSDKNQKEIDENQDVIHDLMQIDNQLNFDEGYEQDVSFVDKMSAIIYNALHYNRGGLIYSHDKVIKVNDKPYKEIPSGLWFAGARDLGINKVNTTNGKLQAVQWRNANDMVPLYDMLYLWNPMNASRKRDAWGYGDSMFTPMIDALRTVRKNMGVNFQAMAETSYAGLGFLIVKPQGQTETEKQDEFLTISQNAAPASLNVLLEDPNHVRLDKLDYNARVKEFSDLNEALLRYTVACAGLPQSMFYDESQSNRATMIGKIQLATATTIQPLREWISRMISPMWYQRWFRLIYKDQDPELLKKFRVKLVFDDLKIEEWFDKVEATNEMDSRKELTDTAYGEQLGLKNYVGMVKTGAETNPGGNAKNSMDIGGGNKLSIKKPKEQIKTKETI